MSVYFPGRLELQPQSNLVRLEPIDGCFVIRFDVHALDFPQIAIPGLPGNLEDLSFGHTDMLQTFQIQDAVHNDQGRPALEQSIQFIVVIRPIQSVPRRYASPGKE